MGIKEKERLLKLVYALKTCERAIEHGTMEEQEHAAKQARYLLADIREGRL